MDTTLATKLCPLMLPEDYEDWLQAWELIRDDMPVSVTTFDALDVFFGPHAHGLFVHRLFYDLDIALHNEGLEDAHLTAKRAELARWVYTNFPEETVLGLGNFRGYEAVSLWGIDQREEAEVLFQELTETYPNFAWGYIWWGDQYWMSDWSYENAPRLRPSRVSLPSSLSAA